MDEQQAWDILCEFTKMGNPRRQALAVEARSVRKKMKDKAFARSVNRQDIIDGAAELGVELDAHIDFCVKALQERAGELGLSGG